MIEQERGIHPSHTTFSTEFIIGQVLLKTSWSCRKRQNLNIFWGRRVFLLFRTARNKSSFISTARTDKIDTHNLVNKPLLHKNIKDSLNCHFLTLLRSSFGNCSESVCMAPRSFQNMFKYTQIICLCEGAQLKSSVNLKIMKRFA